MTAKINVVDEYQEGYFSERFVTVLSEIFLSEQNICPTGLDGLKKRRNMKRSWFVHFSNRNEYDSLPCYEKELDCARKALGKIQ